MTQENEVPTLVRRLVLVFDICSSTTVLEDLKKSDQLHQWRDLLIHIKNYLLHEQDQVGFQVYKFLGDGWILLFPHDIGLGELSEFLSELSRIFHVHFMTRIGNILQGRIDPLGLTFGIDSGELIQVEMNNQFEYIGRAINVACRLQGEAKSLNGMDPSYLALFSRNCYNTLPRDVGYTPLKVKSVTVSLRNISDGKMQGCYVVRTVGSLENDG